jgi:hypothetical protein
MAEKSHGRTEEATETVEEFEKFLQAPTVVPKEGLTGRWAILSVLARAADEPEFMSRLSQDPHEALKEYYTLTQEERAALASGDIQKIENWVGKLDKRLAKWLLFRLSQEKW